MVKKDKIDLRDYLEIFYKRRIHFLTVFFIITTVTTIISYFLPKVYVSKSLILIERQNLLRNIVGQQAVGDEMVSKVRTFKERIISTGNLIDIIRDVADDLRQRGYKGRTVTVKIRFADFKTYTRAKTLMKLTDSLNDIRWAAFQCLKRIELKNKVRLIGVRVSGLEKED